MPFQFGKEKAFQSWKSCLYLDLLVSSSCCQSSFCEAWKERRLLFEAGKVLKFPVWNEKVFPIWKKGFQPWKSCLYLLPIVKTTFAKLGRKKKRSFMKLEKFWSLQPGKKMSFQSGNSNFSTHMVISLELHNHICGTSSSSPQPLFICTHWAFFVCFVTTVFLSFIMVGYVFRHDTESWQTVL